MRARLSIAAAVIALVAAEDARAADETEISAFFISKSENKNQVHYAVRVDGTCKPVGPNPVRAYWRELERGPGVTSPLLEREQAAYGIGSQKLQGGRVVVTLAALPSRPLTIETARGADGACHAWTHATIGGEDAQLWQIHVVLKVLGIDSIVLTGWTWTDRRVVRETLRR
jgi:hypothetical protein